ncbi:MAG: exodeoxyribonuclease III [Gammaproteobacteria bacterium]|nr:exodeoxyribonuclease III [Gammaproteobacteria bacterium]
MKIASWNVNSLRVRLEQVLEWLESTQVDILGVQETKLQDTNFPLEAINSAGYDVLYSGQKTYNGVALLAHRERVVEKLGPMLYPVTNLPGFDDTQKRILAATIGDLRIINLYVPNGAVPDSDKYRYKLAWLEALYEFLRIQLNDHPRMVVMGDFNIAPEDADVHDPKKWEGSVLVSPRERKALQKIVSLGFCDSFRQFAQEDGQFSWWDYRAAGFRLNKGLRIDLILASDAILEHLTGSWIDREPRAWQRPSDHTPVVTEFTF